MNHAHAFVFAALGIIGAAVLPSASAAPIYPVSEDFSTNPSPRGWTASTNGIQSGGGLTASPTANNNNFGYSSTSNVAGGAIGEGGGKFNRTSYSTGETYFADTTLGGTRTLADPFTASGKFGMGDISQGNNGVLLGYMSSGAVPAGGFGDFSFVGMQIFEARRALATMSFVSWNQTVQIPINSSIINLPNTSENFDFAFDYNPTGGVNGLGRLNLHVYFPGTTTDLVGSPVFADLSSTERGYGGFFDSFGMADGWNPINTAENMNIFFDDLNYTMIPEPASASAAILAGIGLLQVRRRRESGSTDSSEA